MRLQQNQAYLSFCAPTPEPVWPVSSWRRISECEGVLAFDLDAGGVTVQNGQVSKAAEYHVAQYIREHMHDGLQISTCK